LCKSTALKRRGGRYSIPLGRVTSRTGTGKLDPKNKSNNYEGWGNWVRLGMQRKVCPWKATLTTESLNKTSALEGIKFKPIEERVRGKSEKPIRHDPTS